MAWAPFSLGKELALALPGPPAHTHLDEVEHLVVHDGGWVVLGQDGPHQHALHKVLAGHQHVEAVPTVFDAGFQDLDAVRCPRAPVRGGCAPRTPPHIHVSGQLEREGLPGVSPGMWTSRDNAGFRDWWMRTGVGKGSVWAVPTESCPDAVSEWNRVWREGGGSLGGNQRELLNGDPAA